MYGNYRLTEDGLVSSFLQPCGCSAEGPGLNCAEGKQLWAVMDHELGRWLDGEISMQESDVSLAAWQTHLGA